MNETTTTSIVKVLSAIVDKKISIEKTKTTNGILLYEAGSSENVQPLGVFSY